MAKHNDELETQVDETQNQNGGGEKKKKNNSKPRDKTSKTKSIDIFSHSGIRLTPKENRFIDLYIETGNQRQAVIGAGYETTTPEHYGYRLMQKTHIADEINYRLQQLHKQSVASAEEILKYLTDVMRGEIKDQFGLEASLSERTKAAQELAKRQIDMPNKVAGNETPEVRIVLDWGNINNDTDSTK